MACPLFKFRFSQLKVVFVLKFLNTPAAVDKLLLARKERMARGTDVETDLFVRRPGFPRVTAGTAHLRVLIFRMYALFHLPSLPSFDLSRTVLFVRYRFCRPPRA